MAAAASTSAPPRFPGGPAMAARGAEAEALFEAHTAAELRAVERRLRAGIEQKREELRQMVGERYRDLIEAADTIAEMRLSAERLLGAVRGLQRGGAARPGPAATVRGARGCGGAGGGAETLSFPPSPRLFPRPGRAAGSAELLPGGGAAEAAAGRPREGVGGRGGRAVPARRPAAPAGRPAPPPAAARRAPGPRQPRPRPLPHPAAASGHRQPPQVGWGCWFGAGQEEGGGHLSEVVSVRRDGALSSRV